MESTRPIRALVRGLDALTVLNTRDGVTVSEVARQIRLPRTTVYRILETLCDAGFAFRDATDERYRLTMTVRDLSGGFHDEQWVMKVAKPCIDELCRDILWPVSLATLAGTSMMLREATDHDTPLASERYSAGCRASLLGSSAGLAYLAFCPRAERDHLLDLLSRSKNAEDKAARVPPDELQALFATIEAQGYATLTATRHLTEDATLSVPVMVNSHVFAVLSVRCATSLVPLKAVIERFLPRLRHSAGKLAQWVTELQIEADASAQPVPGAAA
jgi:IclR family mhp operon transcriptional activator